MDGYSLVARHDETVPENRVRVTETGVEVRVGERAAVLDAIAVDAEPLARIAEQRGVAGTRIGDAFRDIVIMIE